MSKFVDGIEFVTVECCNCGMPFAMTEDFNTRRLNDHGWWYCPRGHQQHYTGKTEAQKLKEQLDRRQRDLEAVQGQAIALKSQRDEVAKSYRKMRDRVKNGVCPCCNRTFQNLMTHMQTEHPEFGKHETLKALRDAYGLTQSALADEIGLSAPTISNYERNLKISDWAKSAIENWMQTNG